MDNNYVQFESKITSTLFAAAEMMVSVAVEYHPQCDGHAESFDTIMVASLRQYINKHQKS